MVRYQLADIEKLDKPFRTQLINSVTGFKPANLIGTIDSSGDTNLAIFSSVLHLGARPPLLGIVSRPDAVPRHTLENIRSTRYYTINSVTSENYQQAHQTSARYERGISEFEVLGIKPLFRDEFPAPFVPTSPVQIGLHLEQEISIELNGTVLLIGSIQTIYIEQDCLQPDGWVDLSKARVVTLNGLDGYCLPEAIERLPYAKVPLK